MRNRKNNTNEGVSFVVKPNPSRKQGNQYDRCLQIFFMLAIPLRLLAAFYMPISDCDEVFNYWEPLHYLLYGRGTRTWEYSPEYGLRSYAYIWLYGGPAWIAKVIGVERSFGKIGIFYVIRIGLAFISLFCEAKFIKSIAVIFNQHIGSITAVIMAVSSGMANASPAFLPQTFTMCTTMLWWSAWMEGNYTSAIFWTAVSGLIGWPFILFAALPLIFEVLYIIIFQAKFRKRIILSTIWSAAICLVPSILIDYFYYHELFVAPINIAWYNRPWNDHGSNIYGEELWTFYFVNLFLNFNFSFLLTLISPLFAIQSIFCSFGTNKKENGKNAKNKKEIVISAVIYLKFASPFFIWLMIMTIFLPHKEERFLFVVYPGLCFSAAFGLFQLSSITTNIMIRLFNLGIYLKNRINSVLIIGTLVICGFVSISRSLALINNYSAPFSVYSQLYHSTALSQTSAELPFSLPSHPPLEQVKVCVGKEWYRFPSHFFLPDQPETLRLEFLKSDFKGLLPKQWDEEQPWMIPSDMNDRNIEELSRYVDINQCEYIIDFDLEDQQEQHYSQSSSWKVVYESQFLDAAHSPLPFRAFYLPIVQEGKNKFRPYQLLKRNSK